MKQDDRVASAGPYTNNLHLSPDDNHAIPQHSVFTGRMSFLPPSQQRQSTEGKNKNSIENNS